MCFSRGSLSVHTTKARQTRSSTRTALWRHHTSRSNCVHTSPQAHLRVPAICNPNWGVAFGDAVSDFARRK